MDVAAIPFNQRVGIRAGGPGCLLELEAGAHHLNHIGTVHAAAQLALAEAASGELLASTFPDMLPNALAVVRRLESTFRRPASLGLLKAKGEIDQATQARFLSDFERRGRAFVTMEIAVEDHAGTLTLQAKVEWFIQKL